MRRETPRGFTLVELLVVIAILGLLMGMLIPAVQASRETARRMACQNNLKNQALALHHFHDAHQQFPPGRYSIGNLDHSWCTYLLPYLEQSNLADQLDLRLPWHDPGGNELATRAVLPIFRCPSSQLEMPGDTDYGGIMGSGLTGMEWGNGRHQAFGSGVLVDISPNVPQPVRMADISDGTSFTLCIAESADREGSEGGRWADGHNTFSHDNGPINRDKSEIFAAHRQGAFVARADGSVLFLSTATDIYIVGALCTRNGGEVVGAGSF